MHVTLNLADQEISPVTPALHHSRAVSPPRVGGLECHKQVGLMSFRVLAETVHRHANAAGNLSDFSAQEGLRDQSKREKP